MRLALAVEGESVRGKRSTRDEVAAWCLILRRSRLARRFKVIVYTATEHYIGGEVGMDEVKVTICPPGEERSDD